MSILKFQNETEKTIGMSLKLGQHSADQSKINQAPFSQDSQMSALDRLENNHSSDLNQYCSALVDMLAENVPDVRSYINIINNVED